ncbi:uncharacterized protein LOC131938928 [Physella acuta]|uniref:uncharacterized protein LOC131938928 n=1 Tax=Physella acuta TaxID=109671 RepID=UPI0027DB58E8|nr:uncharacterized protein LOC131938928 [Physella acuta]
MFLVLICLSLASVVTSQDSTSVPKNYGLEVCANGAQLVGHPQACQRYYNCSDTTPRGWRSYLGPYEVECAYPKLFDIRELACKDYKVAECGPNRIAAKDPCDYVVNRCLSAHCQPCSSRMPSCVGLPDGLNVNPDRLWTPYFIRCEDERLVGTGSCPKHSPTAGTGFFSPLTKSCVSIFEVPRTTGYGLAPSCEGKLQGFYLTAERPDVYYTCPSGQVYYCPAGTTYNQQLNQCK